jgi:hypothetical protein
MRTLACLVLLAAPAQEKAAPKVAVDVSQAPDLKDWADQAKKLCEEWHPRMSEFLASKGFTPPAEVSIVFVKDMKGVAETSGNKIRISADWVRKHPEDTGMVVHELCHVVQSYPPGGPGWVTEGVADYVRYFLYENKTVTPRERRKGSWKDGYRTSASFLAWVAAKHDKDLVVRLNAAMRSSAYKDALFKDWTGKDLEALWADYQAAD